MRYVSVWLLLSFIGVEAVLAETLAARLTRQGFVLLGHPQGSAAPRATVGDTRRDVLQAPVAGPSFTLPVSADGTVQLPAGSLPAPPDGALGWRLAVRYTSGLHENAKRTRYTFVPASAHGAAQTLQPMGRRAASALVQSRLALPVQQRHTHAVGVLPPAARLHVAHALLNDWRVEGGAGARFVVSLAVDGGAPVILHDETSTAREQDERARSWREIDLDLADYAGQDATIFFETHNAPGAPTPNLAFPVWGDPVLYTAAPPMETPRPGIVLVSLDTLRADRLGCYGYARPTTPNLDALAAESYLFENALTRAPMTTPAHASAFTGVSPYVHRAGVFSEGFRLKQQWPMVAQLLTAQGYRTGAFTEGIALASSLGFSRGFQSYSDGPSPDRHKRDIIATTFSDAASWMERYHRVASLLFVHTYHAHDPYTAPADVVAKFVDPAYTGRPIVSPEQAVTPEERRNASDHYDAGIAHTDAAFGRFLDELRARGQYDNRWIIVFSDHGEEFWEHGGVAHARSLNRESVHVPLLIRPPGGVPSGKRISDTVLLTDLFATLLTIAGVAAPSAVDSQDLLAVAGGALAPREELHGFYRGYEFPKADGTPQREWETFSVRTRAYSYIRTSEPPTAPPREEIYEALDVAERNDLAATASALIEAARAALQRYQQAHTQVGAAAGAPGLAPEEVDALQGLGYF